MSIAISIFTAALCTAVPALAQAPRPSAADRSVALEETATGFDATGPGFEAAFAADVVRLTTEPAAADRAAPELTIRYLGSQRTGHTANASAAAEPRAFGEGVGYLRDGCSERYELTTQGIEQSFHFATRPNGTGDLILTMRVAGNVHAPAFAPAHRAFEFRHDDAPAIRYGEAIAYDRTGQRVDVRTSYDGVDTLQLHVPAKFVDTASYPLVVDPVIGSVFLPGGSTDNDSRPGVAYDPVHDTYMVVWQRRFSSTDTRIRARIYNADGTPRTIAFPITLSGSPATDPDVTWIETVGQQGFAVVWCQNDAIRMMVLDGDTGAITHPDYQVSSPAANETDGNPSVAGPGAISVAWDRTPAGASNPDRIMFRIMDFATNFPLYQTFGSEKTITQVFSGGYVQAPKLANDVKTLEGTDWYWWHRIVWERFYDSPAPGDFDVHTASFRVTAFNDILSYVQSESAVFDAATPGIDERNPSIAAIADQHFGVSGADYLIAWQDDDDILARRYSGSGPAGATVTVRATANYEGTPAVAAGANEFTVGYLEIPTTGTLAVDVRAARISRIGAVLTSNVPVDVLGSPFQNHLCVASRPIQDPGAPRNNRTMFAWTGNTGPTGGVPDVRASLFANVTGSTMLFGTGCPGPNGELPAIGTAGDLNPGSGDFTVTVSDAPPLSIAALFCNSSFANAPIPGAPGCNLYVGLPFLFAWPTLTSPVGEGQVTIPLPLGIPSGSLLAFQWGIYTPGHNAFGWIVSNDVDVRWDQ